MQIKPLVLIDKQEPPRSKLAAVYGLPETTPDNLVRMYAGELLANTQAHKIKADYDSNNPPPAPLTKEGLSHDFARPASPNIKPGDRVPDSD